MKKIAIIFTMASTFILGSFTSNVTLLSINKANVTYAQSKSKSSTSSPKKKAAQKTIKLTKSSKKTISKPKKIAPKKPLKKSNVKPLSQKSTRTKSRVNSRSTSRGKVSSMYGSLIDWKEASSVFPRGKDAKVTDLYTGRTFNVRRTMGANHADCEPLTKQDTAIIKDIWGGFNWTTRPVIVNVNGKKLAASMSSMGHAGVDSEPAYVTVDNRSGGYGTGENLDTIKNNDMDGHFDIHFLNSTTHKTGKQNPLHQAAVLKAAGQ